MQSKEMWIHLGPMHMSTLPLRGGEEKVLWTLRVAETEEV